MCSPRFWKGLSNRPFSPHGRALRWRPKLYSRGFHTDGKDELCSGRRARQAFPDTLRAHPWALGRRHPCRRTVREGLARSPLWESGSEERQENVFTRPALLPVSSKYALENPCFYRKFLPSYCHVKSAESWVLCLGAAIAPSLPGHATSPSLGAWPPTSVSANSPGRPIAISAVGIGQLGEVRKCVYPTGPSPRIVQILTGEPVLLSKIFAKLLSG